MNNEADVDDLMDSDPDVIFVYERRGTEETGILPERNAHVGNTMRNSRSKTRRNKNNVEKAQIELIVLSDEEVNPIIEVRNFPSSNSQYNPEMPKNFTPDPVSDSLPIALTEHTFIELENKKCSINQAKSLCFNERLIKTTSSNVDSSLDNICASAKITDQNYITRSIPYVPDRTTSQDVLLENITESVNVSGCLENNLRQHENNEDKLVSEDVPPAYPCFPDDVFASIPPRKMGNDFNSHCRRLDLFLEEKEKNGEKCRIRSVDEKPVKRRVVKPNQSIELYSERVIDVLKSTFKKLDSKEHNSILCRKSFDDTFVPAVKVTTVTPLSVPGENTVFLTLREAIKMKKQKKMREFHSMGAISYDKLIPKPALNNCLIKKKENITMLKTDNRCSNDALPPPHKKLRENISPQMKSSSTKNPLNGGIDLSAKNDGSVIVEQFSPSFDGSLPICRSTPLKENQKEKEELDRRYFGDENKNKKESVTIKRISFEDRKADLEKKKAGNVLSFKTNRQNFLDVPEDSNASIDVPDKIREIQEEVEKKNNKKKTTVDRRFYEETINILSLLVGYDRRIEDKAKDYKDSDHLCADIQRSDNCHTQYTRQEKEKLKSGKVKLFMELIDSRSVKVPFDTNEGLYVPIFDPNDLTNLEDSRDWHGQGIRNLCANNTYHGVKAKKMFLCDPPEDLMPSRSKESHAQRVKRILDAKQSSLSHPRFAYREGCVRRFSSETHEQRQMIERENENLEKERRKKYCGTVQAAVNSCKRDRFTSQNEENDKVPVDWYCPNVHHMVTCNNNKNYFKTYLDFVFGRKYLNKTRFHKVRADDAIMAALVHSLGPERFESASHIRPSSDYYWQVDYTHIHDMKKMVDRRRFYDRMKNISNIRSITNSKTLLEGWTVAQMMIVCRLEDNEKYDWMQIYQHLAQTYRMYPPLSSLNFTKFFEYFKERIFRLKIHRKLFHDRFIALMNLEKEAESKRNQKRIEEERCKQDRLRHINYAGHDQYNQQPRENLYMFAFHQQTYQFLNSDADQQMTQQHLAANPYYPPQHSYFDPGSQYFF